MFAIPDHDLRAPSATLSESLLRGVPRSYAVLFFNASPRLGWFLMAISMLAPDLGLVGLAGLIATGILAWGLGYDHQPIRSGFLLFNSLLVCLTLAWLHRSYQFPLGIYAALLLASLLGSLFLSAALQHAFATYLGLSAHSLPAVITAYVLYFIGYSLYGPAGTSIVEPCSWLDLDFLPTFWKSMFQAFGAMIFQARATPGILVFTGLALCSPLTALIAAAAFAAGAGTMAMLGINLDPENITWCGFNFLLCGIALGAGYYVPSRGSLLLALAGAFLCALVALALSTALRYFGLPASALPYNLVVLVMVYALKQRKTAGALHPSPAPGALPESAARLVLINSHRFPQFHLPAISLPFAGERTITQGMDGALTHRGLWRYAFDFEAEQGGRKFLGEGTTLEEFHTWDTLVLAPCNGIVSSVVNHVRDNAPGENNPDENWGNSIILFSDAGYYIMLAHLRQGTVNVAVGQRITRGDLLGRCGNSGRSPVPHLHLQIQDTTVQSAPTRPFCLKHYLEFSANGSQRIYRTSGIPSTGVRIMTAITDQALNDGLSGWLPGAYRYKITGDKGETWEETIVLDFDEQGRFRLSSKRCAAQLTAFLSEGVFYTTDYQGTDASLLAYMATGLARVPCVGGSDVIWHDEASAIPFHQAPLRWLHDVADPFIGPSMMECDYRLLPDSSGHIIFCQVEPNTQSSFAGPAHAPTSIQTHIAPRRGVVHMAIRLQNDRTIKAEIVEYLLQPARLC